jgi:hypothetical protein
MAQLSAFLTMMMDQATELAKDDETAQRPPSTLEQRICIGMIQARALECRHTAGSLLIYGQRVVQRFPLNQRAAVGQAITAISVQLRERSHKLEKLGMDLARKWPPEEDNFEESRLELVQ